MPDLSPSVTGKQEVAKTSVSPEIVPEIDVWATQLLVADLDKEVKTRVEGGIFQKLASPENTSGVLLGDDNGIRIFLFPKELAPGEPDECQLYNSGIPLTKASEALAEMGFSFGAINNSCPWGPYMEVKSSKGEISYVYNLLDAYSPSS